MLVHGDFAGILKNPGKHKLAKVLFIGKETG
jgi:hypothetical protein